MMSWKTINAILGRAAVDAAFCQELLKNPLATVKQQKFMLTREEEEKLSRISAQSLTEFSRQILIVFERKE